MAAIKKTMHIWWFQYRYIVLSGKFFIMSIILFMLIHYYLKDFAQFLKDYDVTAFPLAITVLFTDNMFGCLGIMLLIFLLSVFPVRNHIQFDILGRSGCINYCHAQIVTILSLVFTWIIEMQLFTFILLGSHMELQDWGKGWGAAANGTMADMGYMFTFFVNRVTIPIIPQWLSVKNVYLSGWSYYFENDYIVLLNAIGLTVGITLVVAILFYFRIKKLMGEFGDD